MKSKSIRKILSVLLAFCLAFVVVPISAQALYGKLMIGASNYDMGIGASGTGWVWDGNDTLTLEQSYGGQRIYFDCSSSKTVNIIYTGDVTVENTSVYGNGISCKGNLNISSSGGILTVKGGEDGNGIYTVGSLTISDSANVTAAGNRAISASKDITINTTGVVTLTGTGSDYTVVAYDSISPQNLEILNGVVKIFNQDPEKYFYANLFDGGDRLICAVGEFKVNINTPVNGTATVSPDKYIPGAEVEIIAIPNAGYEFDRIEVTGNHSGLNGNKFTMGNQEVTVTVHFKQKLYNVTVNNDGNGTATASSTTAVQGTEIEIDAIPNAGYEFDRIEVTGEHSSLNGNKFTMGYEDVTVTVHFKQKQHDVMVATHGNGTATASPQKAAEGTPIEIVTTPELGYEFDRIEVIGNHLDLNGNKFTLGDDSVTVTVHFKPIEYVVNVAPSVNGTATADCSKATIGTEVEIIPIPDAGYEFDRIKVTGNHSGLNGNKFIMGYEDVTVKVYFKVESDNPTEIDTIDSITVIPARATLKAGGTQKFDADVNGTGTVSQEVTWLIRGNKSQGTTIDQIGNLKVDADEPVGKFDVIVVSDYDSEIFTRAEVTVVDHETEIFTVKFNANGGVFSGGNTVITQTVAKGSRAVAPASPIRNGYIFTGWDKAFANITGDITVNASWRKNTSGGGSTGGGSTSSGGYYETINADKYAGNVAKTPASALANGVTTAQAESAAKTAAKAAENSGAEKATAKLKNVANITLDNISAMIKAAGMPVEILADSMTANGKAVDVRLTIDTEKSRSDLNLAASTVSTRADKICEFFGKWFVNKIQVISLGQQGEFGQSVKIAAKLNITGVDAENIALYSYDSSANTYKLLASQDYRIDANGYIHFTTTIGGDIVVSENTLVKK